MAVKDYFQSLAAEHTMVQHRSEEAHFASSLDDAATLMARRLHYPAMFLDEGDISFEGTTGNVLMLREYAIAFVDHVKDAGNEAEKNTAFETTFTIMRDTVARMVRDKTDLVQEVRHFDPIGAEAHRVELSEAGLYGWVFLFSLPTNLSTLNCNEHFAQ